MSQIFHTFRKDARRHWVEILVSLLLLAVYTWQEPRTWGARVYAFGFMRLLEGTVDVLLPVSWCFLIVRVIHGEALVGDRQFWVTRPYEWWKLLAAKVFFVAAFINVPLFVAQAILLKEAGVAIVPRLVGVLQMHVGIGLVFLLPATLGAVTRGLGQAVLVAIGAILALMGAAALSSVIPNAEMSWVDAVGKELQGWLALLAPSGAILWQYARRRTWQSRRLLLGAAAAMLLIEVASPYDSLVRKRYALVAEGRRAPVQLAFEPEAAPAKKKEPLRNWRDEMFIRIPLRVSGVGADKVVDVAGVRVEIEGPNGIRWSPGWKGRGPGFWPDQESASVSFEMKKELFERMKSLPVTMRISLAMTEYSEREVREVVATDGEFVVPGVGLCRIEDGSLRSLQCRAPLREPSVMASVASSKTACSGEEESDLKAPEERVLHVLRQRGDDDFVNFGISPVRVFPIYFDDSYVRRSSARKDLNLRLCPGAHIRFAKPEEVGRSRIELKVEGVRLEDYEVSRWMLD